MGTLVKKVKGLVWEKPYGQTVKLSLVAVLNISWVMSVINKGTDSGKPCGFFFNLRLLGRPVTCFLTRCEIEATSELLIVN